jgi:hypothetical protein
VQYTIIEDRNCISLEKRVQELLNDGWQLYGNLLLIPNPSIDDALLTNRSATIYAQALINENDPVEPVEAIGFDYELLSQILQLPEDRLTPEYREWRSGVIREFQDVIDQNPHLRADLEGRLDERPDRPDSKG